MKILFVGIFKNQWSTNIPMVLELKKKNHKVICFDYRYKLKENLTKIQNPNTNHPHKNNLKSFIKNNYLNFISKIEKLDFPFFKFIIKINRFYLFGRSNINRQLINEVKKEKYDIVFLAKIDSINYKIIPKINKYAKTWYYFMDDLIMACKMNAYEYAALSTWSSSTYSSVNRLFKRYGANSYFITQGVSPDIFNPAREKRYKEIDVIFVGSRSPKREKFINILKKNDINIICYGPGWTNKPIYLYELAKKYRTSKIILNFNTNKIGFSIRVFQAMGTGSFLLSEYCYDLEKIFEKGIHLDWFITPEELLKMIKYYLENEAIREKIAQQGSKYVYDKFSWKKIIEKILRIIENSNNKHK